MPSSLERKLTEVNEARALSINNCQIKIQQHVHLLLLYKVETHPTSYGEAPKIVFLFPPSYSLKYHSPLHCLCIFLDMFATFISY